MNRRLTAILKMMLGGVIVAIASSAFAAGATDGQRVRVAAISFVPERLDLAGNADRLEQAFRKAAAGGARLAVAPEGALDGYIINQVLAGEIPLARIHDVSIPVEHALIHRFRTLAREIDLCVVFGFAEKSGGEIFNTAVFIDHTGAIRGNYRKMQFAEGYHPSWWFNRLGDQSRTFETPFGRCGVLICNDRWNAALAKIPALDGAQFLVIPSFGSTGKAQDDAVLSRSRETNLPIVEANVGVSLIISEGKVVAVNREKTSITFAEIVIPGPIASKPAERDTAEREFLAWRDAEMRRRYEEKRHRLASADSSATP